MLVIAFAGSIVGFLGGWQYGKSKALGSSGRNGQFGGMMGSNPAGVRNGFGSNGQNRFRPIVGEISARDDSSITIKSQDGSSKIILLTTNTAIEKTEVGSNSDMAIGKTVRILGTENTDGSVTAQDVQLNPMIRNPSPALNKTN